MGRVDKARLAALVAAIVLPGTSLLLLAYIGGLVVRQLWRQNRND